MADWKDGCGVWWVMPWPVDVPTTNLPNQTNRVDIRQSIFPLLSIRARKALESIITPGDRFPVRDGQFLGATLVSDLQGITLDDLLEPRNCGMTTAHEIASALAFFGLKVRP